MYQAAYHAMVGYLILEKQQAVNLRSGLYYDRTDDKERTGNWHIQQVMM